MHRNSRILIDIHLDSGALSNTAAEPIGQFEKQASSPPKTHPIQNDLQTRSSVTMELQEQASGVEISNLENLRSKLQQILPRGSSSDKARYAKTRDAGTHQMMPDQNTIETDSETTKRPLTRKSARLRAHVPRPTRNSKPKSSSRGKGAKVCKSTKPGDSLNIQRVVATRDEMSTPAKEVDANTGQFEKPASSQAKTRAFGRFPTAPRSKNFTRKPLSRDKEARQCNSISSSAQQPMPPAVSRGCLATKHTDSAKKSSKSKPGVCFDRHNSDSLDGKATSDDRYSNVYDSSIKEKNAGDGVPTLCQGETDSTEEVSHMKRAYMEDVQTSSEIRSQKVVSSPVFNAGEEQDILEESEDSPETRLQRWLTFEENLREIDASAKKSLQKLVQSTSEDFLSELPDIESSIQTDVRRLISNTTITKRQLETRLQEQREHLKSLHNGYMQAIDKYLKYYTNVTHGLETKHLELEGEIEAQKASQFKVVSQAKDSLENKMRVAEGQIRTICEVRRTRIQEVKRLMAEQLADGMSGHH